MIPAMLRRLSQRNEWHFFAALPRASPGLAAAWWGVLLLRGLLPAGFALAGGALLAALQEGRDLAPPLALVGTVFVLLQVLAPLHQAISANLGSRVAAWLYDRLTAASVGPPGIGHLEDPALAGDLVAARDFDLGMTAPPMHVNVDFIAGSLVMMVGGLAAALALFAYAWWAPLVLGGAWLATHWLLRESAVWSDRNTEPVRAAQRHADYAYRLAVDPPAAKELRLFGLADWTLARFLSRRKLLQDLQYEATRLRERPLALSLVLVCAGNLAVLGAIAADAWSGRLALGAAIAYAQLALATAMIAFGGLNWALDGAAAPVAAMQRLAPAMATAGALAPAPTLDPATTVDDAGAGRVRLPPRLSPAGVGRMPAREVRFHDVTFAYPRADRPVLSGFDLTIPAGSSLAIVGQNGAGKTTLAKLLCRLYDPQSGAVEVDGVDLRALDVASWRARVAAVFQDFIRYELPLRENVAPAGAPDEVILAALDEAGAAGLAALDTPLARGYAGGTDLSGGQWQRVALARALCAVRLGAGLVLLDEPTAQLDVRGEAEIFDRLLRATRHATTILVSHRFSTVRHADRICVLEHGRVIELGSHDELMAKDGRYRTMFELQAKRFGASEDEEGRAYEQLA
jgi:ABC-type multidrug transport system fused ATPase/permease subunit